MNRIIVLITAVLFISSCFGPPKPKHKKNMYAAPIDTAQVYKTVPKTTTAPAPLEKSVVHDSTIAPVLQPLQDTVTYTFNLFSNDGRTYHKMYGPVFLEFLPGYISLWEQNQEVNSYNLYEVKHIRSVNYNGVQAREVETLYAPNSYLPPNNARKIIFTFIEDQGKVVFMKFDNVFFASQLPNGVIPSTGQITNEEHKSTRSIRVGRNWSISQLCGGEIIPGLIMTREEFNKLNPKYRYTDNLLYNTFIHIPQ